MASMAEHDLYFLQSQNLTEISPLLLQFRKGEVHLSNNNLQLIQQWAQQIKKYNVPVFINTYASSPTGIRNLTKGAAHHEAIRVAFDRGLIAKNILRQYGIDDNRLVIKAIASEQSQNTDGITLTIRSH